MGNIGCCGYQAQATKDVPENTPQNPPPAQDIIPIQEVEEVPKPVRQPRRKTKKLTQKPENLENSGSTELKLNSALRIRRGTFVHYTKGNIIQMYSIIGVLGKGSFGRVYKVKHKITSDIRAVKVLSKENISEAGRSKVLFEVEVLRSLDHPNILTVFEVYEDEKQFCIVTELCHGGELFDKIISAKRFSEEIAANYMYQIMSAILTCHEREIVHRDLKPENILFTSESPDSPLKVIDFGTSRKLEAKSTLSSLTGTAYYIAPEVIKGSYDFKCDIWSCGVILYIMLCGYPPFRGNNEEAILSNISKGHFNFSGKEWASVSQEAKGLIMKMLTKNPQRRPTAKEIFHDPWIQNTVKNSRNKEIAMRSLKNLSHFRASRKLQQATLEFIASQMISNQETKFLRQAFISLDANGDGKLSVEELRQGYKDARVDLVDIDKIIESCDGDGNGFIDYTEFLTATINWKKELSHERLEAVFKMFDKDGSGKIGLNEVKSIFGEDSANIHEGVWSEIMHEADLDGDGEIDLYEFKALMLKRI